MCGIFGYVGRGDALKFVLNGIKKLEYRGYDSSGIAGLENGQLVIVKEMGKISILEESLRDQYLQLQGAIAHTRWATHGGPSKKNAHPHYDTEKKLALVHNGIIENHFDLKKFLLEKEISSLSETDSELVANLFGYFARSHTLVEAIRLSLPYLKGSYAFALMHQDFPNQIIALANESPLAIGIGEDEAFVSSDANAFLPLTKDVIFLSHGEVAVITPQKIEIYNEKMEKVAKQKCRIAFSQDVIDKGDYEHFTLKEIFDQPQAVRNALYSRFDEEFGNSILEGLEGNDFLSVQRILILACGTSYHAGCIAAYMIEDKVGIPVQVEIASEFRYKNPIVQKSTLVIAISQSGETADTIAAMREVKAKGAKVLSICNVSGSTLTREADHTLLLHAGPEIGVCSTKAFTTQVIVLSLLTLLLGRTRHLSKQDGKKFIEALKKIPDQIQMILNHSVQIHALARKYAPYHHFFFIGRRYMYPSSLEGALKLKEISYINANGYPAGEMKHGPIALIDDTCPTVALCADTVTYEKLVSNLLEVKARNGRILAIAYEGQVGLEQIADDVFYIPVTIDELSPILSTVATQLFSYYIAKERGTEIDQPRNLAKSVTVE